MDCESRLFTEFVNIFLEREFASAISASLDERRRDDLRLTKYAVREAILKGQFEPDKPRIVEDRSSGKVRRIAVWPVRERLVMRALHRAMSSRLVPRFLPGCIGGVKGRSRHDALKVLARGEAERRRWALVADVANFFASVDQEKLGRQLARMRVPGDIRGLLLHFVGDACPGGKGIPLGAPFSKLPGNVCLHPLDQKLAEHNLPWCRFVDDVLILSRSRDEAESLMVEVRAVLAQLGFLISEPRTGISTATAGDSTSSVFTSPGAPLRPRRKPLTALAGGCGSCVSAWGAWDLRRR